MTFPFKLKKLSIGARINRALRAFLMLLVYCMLGSFILGVIAFSFLMVEVDKEIAPKFENMRWSLPARVYARPLELFIDSKISLGQLKQELELAQYKETDRLNRQGSYRVNANSIDIFTRSFAYSDGIEASRKLTITINNGVVTQINSTDAGEKINLVRLEPAEIASIYPQHNEDRILLQHSETPRALIDALLAMEDRSFYTHMGVNPKAIIRAMIINLKAGKNIQGGSTLTQQLIKNYFLTDERSLNRKIKEALYALAIDYRYPKDAILEAYMNEIFLGQDGSRAIHGFGLASWFYFGKPVEELGLHEIALLIGIVPAPGAYNPRKSPDVALKRRNLVLDVMAQRNLISVNDVSILKKLPLGVIEKPHSSGMRYPAFMDLVNKQLKIIYTKDDLATEGLKIFTTLDPVSQAKAEESIVKMMPQLEKVGRQKTNSLQAAIVIVKTQTGELEAIVGDRDFTRVGFNRAMSAKRQIGSLIKPIIYLRALENPTRFNLASPINGSQIEKGEFGNWQPKNYTKNLEHSTVPLITALAKSYNLPTVRLGMAVTVEEVINTLYRLGLSPDEYQFQPFPSLLLGALEMTPLDVAQIYSTIANGGYRTPIRVIREVTTAEGNPLVQSLSQPIQAVYPEYNYLIMRGMQEVVNSGTAGSMKAKIKTAGMAGKTGTTNDNIDSWFAGFSGDRTTITWIVRDDNKGTGLTGSSGGLKLWIDLMAKLTLEPVNTNVPPGIVFANVDMSTGFLPNEFGGCGGPIVNLPFIRNYEPKQSAECWFNESYSEIPDE